MQRIKSSWSSAKQIFTALEYRGDQWLLRNPIALWKYLRFRAVQKTTYNRGYRQARTLRETVPIQ
jgi:hypothetical protein